MPLDPKQQPPYYTPGTAASTGKKYYTVAVTQTGTGQLTVATVFENTIGTITIARQSAGWFLIQSAGLFTVNKTYLPNMEQNGYGAYPLSSSAVNAEFYTFKIIDADNIDLQFFNAAYANADPSAIFGNGFTLHLPTITVYP